MNLWVLVDPGWLIARAVSPTDVVSPDPDRLSKGVGGEVRPQGLLLYLLVKTSRKALIPSDGPRYASILRSPTCHLPPYACV